MKNFTLLILAFLSAVACGLAQPTINFEAGGAGASYTWKVFENADNPALEIVNNPSATGVNTSAKVAKFIARLTGQPYAGVESHRPTTEIPTPAVPDISPFTFNATNSTVKIMVYKTVISDVGLKFVTSTGASSQELKVANTKTNQWEELTFDFSGNNFQGGLAYNQLVVFSDFKARTTETISYFDNVTFSAKVVPPPGTEPTVAAPTPTATNVISIFSDAYTNVAGTDFSPNWSQNPPVIVSQVAIAGNNTLKYANLSYQGTQFGSSQNVSAKTTMHIDYWTADAASLQLFLISPGPVETPYTFTVVKGAWQSVDIPLTAFSPVALTDVIQLKVVGTGTVYFDNMYFYTPSVIATEPTVAAPTPTATNVISIFSDAYTNVAGTDFSPNWSQNPPVIVSQVAIAGNNTLKYANLSYQGTQFGSSQNVSAKTTMHIDYWTADAASLQLFLISPGPVETPYTLTVVKGAWQSVDIPLTAFSPVALTDVIQLKVVGTGTVYLDNIYFYTPSAPPVLPTLPLDFESITIPYTFTDFDGGSMTVVANPNSGGINTSLKAAKMVKSAGKVWGGSWLGLNAPIDFSTNKLFKAKIYSPRVGAKVLLKVENQTNGEVKYEKEVATTVANTWEELSFDYSTIDVTKSYQKVTFIFDNGTMGDGSANFTFYVDDVKLVPSTTPPPAEPTVAATPPTRLAANVLSVYSNSYTNINGVNLNPGWEQATVQSEVQLGGNNTLKLANLNYQGVELATAQNVSSYAGVHIDYWTSTSTDFNFYLISINPTVDNKKHTFAITKGAWQSVDIPLTTYAGVDLTKLAQMKFDGNGTLFIDNIYFYKEATKQNQVITFPAITEKALGGAPFTLTATASSGLAVKYTPTSDKVTISENTVTIVKAGSVTIKAIQAGNDSFNPAPEVSQTFCVKPAKPTITVSGLNTAETVLTSNSLTGNQWYLNGNAIAGATGATHTIASAGSYTVQVSVDGCLSDFSTEVSFIVTGDILSQHGNAVAVYPNPAESSLQIKGLAGQVFNAQVVDVTGRSTPILLEKIEGAHKANVEHLSHGIYFITVQEGNRIVKLKFIKK